VGTPNAVLCIKEWTVTALHGARYPDAVMLTLLDDLEAFYLEHRRVARSIRASRPGACGWCATAGLCLPGWSICPT